MRRRRFTLFSQFGGFYMIWMITLAIVFFGFMWVVSDSGREGGSSFLAFLVSLGSLGLAWWLHGRNTPIDQIVVVMMPVLMLSAKSCFHTSRELQQRAKHQNGEADDDSR